MRVADDRDGNASRALALDTHPAGVGELEQAPRDNHRDCIAIDSNVAESSRISCDFIDHRTGVGAIGLAGLPADCS